MYEKLPKVSEQNLVVLNIFVKEEISEIMFLNKRKEKSQKYNNPKGNRKKRSNINKSVEWKKKHKCKNQIAIFFGGDVEYLCNS